MRSEIYIDVVFVTNLLMDFVLLRLVGSVFRCRGRRGRILFSAVLGALFSCLILYIQESMGPFFTALLHSACAAGMVRLAYGMTGALLLKATVTLYLSAFLCGGLWEAFGVDAGTTAGIFLLTAGATYFLLSAVHLFSSSIRARMSNVYPVTLSYRGKVESAYGFYDTGNLLLDSVSGAPVSVMKPEILEKMLSGELVEKLKHFRENPGELENTELASLRPHLLPYLTVGRTDGLMLAIVLDDLCIHTPREVVHVPDPVFALAVEPSTLGKEYKVLLNSRLLH